MSTTRDPLDDAIDQVAARMVAVPDDQAMTVRIVGALPERRSRLRWLIPQFAAIGAIVIAALVWTTRERAAPPVATLPSSHAVRATVLANVVAANEPGTSEPGTVRTRTVRTGTQPLEPPEPPEPPELDHERSLAPIETVAALVVPSLAPAEIPAAELLTIVAIDIVELPMTAESFSQRK